MLKDKADRICQFCKKTFCCTKCRDRHVDKVHPGLSVDCPLCASKILPIRQFEFEKLDLKNEKLSCHIINKHLPLQCKLCGDLFKSKEDFKTLGACKSQYWNPLMSPTRFEYLEKKLKQCSMCDSDCNNSRFRTPPEIYRQTSTPMLVDQKTAFETPCAPNFSLKTPQTNSPLIGKSNMIFKTRESQISETRNITEYFSFSTELSNEETTPFRTVRDEDCFFINSGRKLDIMEERDEAAMSDISSPVDMDLTDINDGILQNSLKLDVTSEESDRTPDIVKKVRFSDQHEMSQFDNPMRSCVKTILNTSMENEKLQDARNSSDMQNPKNAKDTKDVKDSEIIMENMEDAKNAKDNQVMDKKCPILKPLQNSLSNSQIEVVVENMSNEKKEYPEGVYNGCLSPVSQQNSNRVLMMVLMGNNSRLSTDLMPLISSGLKKMQEQLTNSQSSSDRAESSNICKKSTTKMKMTVESVESYSVDNVTANHREVVSDNETSKSNGFLSVVAQVMKNALKSFSGLKNPSSSIETAGMIRRRETIEEFSQGSSSNVSAFSLANNIQARSAKRAREITEVSSKVDSIAVTMDIRSPLAKRHRGWYKMIRGRQPIKRMRNNHVATSPRRVSTETQVFHQGSLTVGDTVLPLPTRAHQSTQTESDNLIRD